MGFSTLVDSVIPAKHSRERRTTGPRLHVVIHSVEADERTDTAEAVGNYFANVTRKASTHTGVDVDTIVGYVDENRACFGAGGANDSGYHVEHAGYARQTAAEWLDPYGLCMLDRSARLTADWCRRDNIPVVELTPAQFNAGARGFVSHATVVIATGLGDHTDPGVGFPWTWYLDRVRRYVNNRSAFPHLCSGDTDGNNSTGPGEPVAFLQAALEARGFELPEFGVDGRFGGETEDAVKAFQAANGITPTGVVTDAAWEILSTFTVPPATTAPPTAPTTPSLTVGVSLDELSTLEADVLVVLAGVRELKARTGAV